MSIRNVVTAWTLAGLLAASRLAAGASSAVLYLEPETNATITVTGIAERWSGEGFMPVRARVENHANRARTWTLLFSTYRGYSGQETRFETPLTAGAGTVTETVIFVPGGASDPRGASLQVRAEGPGAAGSYGQLLQTTSDTFILTATTPAQESAVFSATNGAPGAKTDLNAVDPARWPADWRTWSPFQRVVLTEPEYTALDGARRAALRDWVALGGTLDLYPARSGGQPDGLERVGHGAIRRRQASLAEEASVHPEVQLHTSAHPGVQNSRHAEVSTERRKELEPGTGALGLSFFLLGFGVLVGPINLFVFAPAGRRQRLFATVPLISLAASALMVGYIVVKDGFGGEGSQRGLVLLLPESNQAVITQQQVARTGVLLGGGFDLADDVVLAPVTENPDVYRPSRDSSVFQRSGSRADGDWFASRKVQEQRLTRLVPTRARVELIAENASGTGPVVQSSVGVVLRDFRLLDARGRSWAAAEVAPGARATLQPAAGTLTAGMQRGTFAALGGAAEGLAPIPTLASIRWDDAEFLYTGPLTGARP